MNRPSDSQTIRVLRIVAALMGADCAHVFGDGFYFALDDRWSLRVSPDDAGRFRLQACYDGRSVATMWCLGIDSDRLADLVADFRSEVQALVRG